MQRSLSRLGLRRGNSKDLGLVRNSLRAIREIKNVFNGQRTPPLLTEVLKNFKGFKQLLGSLDSALVENPTESSNNENIIRSDYDKSLKQFRQMISTHIHDLTAVIAFVHASLLFLLPSDFWTLYFIPSESVHVPSASTPARVELLTAAYSPPKSGLVADALFLDCVFENNCT